MRKLLASLAVASVIVGLAPIAAQAASSVVARFAPALERELAGPGDEQLLVLVHGTSRDAAVAAVDDAGLRQITVLESIGVPAAVGSAAQVEALRSAPGVRYVELDQAIELHTDTANVATRTTEAQTVFQTAEGTPLYTGAGRSIAVVDGGIDGTHPMFQRADGTSKVVRNLKVACHDIACPADGTSDPLLLDLTGAGNDTDTPSVGGHGTHVASIAAGIPQETQGRTVTGTAPGADLVGISVGETLSIFAADVALDWIARHHADPCEGLDHACNPISVVNNSYGPAGGGEFDPDGATAAITARLVADGVVVVWANGNGDAANDGGDGSDNRSNPEGQNPLPGVISVANYDDHDAGTREGTLDSSSSRGDASDPSTWPDVSAPGTNITAACRPYLVICNGALNPGDPNYGTIGGTSMAAPHVAGIVALLQEAAPGITPADVEWALEDTAHRFAAGAPYWTVNRDIGGDATRPRVTSFDKGTGLVDTVAALGVVTSTTPPASESAACTAPLLTDAQGDATRVIVDTPLPSEPGLDIVSGDLVWDATAQALTFHIGVLDLAATDPAGSTGSSFDFNFAYEGASYFVLASRDATNGPDAYLGVLGTAGRAHVVDDLATTFDADADRITVVLPNSALAGTEVTPIADGDELNGLGIVARRQLSVNGTGAIPDVDDATTKCSLVVGGTSTPPEPQPFPEPAPDDGGDGEAAPTDATLHDGESFETEATTTEDTSGVPGVDGYECEGTRDPKCFTYRVDAVPGASSTMNVWLDPSLDSVVLDDWDVYVYDADGNEVDDVTFGAVFAPNAGPQTVTEVYGLTFDVPAAATYTIVLQPYTVASGVSITLHADLVA